MSLFVYTLQEDNLHGLLIGWPSLVVSICTQSNLHPALPITCPGFILLILPFLMWIKLAWQWQCFSPLSVFPLAAAAHSVLTATDGRGYWGWKPPWLFGSPMPFEFRHVLSCEGSCHGRDIKKMDDRTLFAVLPVLTQFTSTALPLLTYHHYMQHDGSQSEGTVLSACQAAGKTQMAVSWPCAVTPHNLFSLLSCLFTLVMVRSKLPP